MAQGSEPASAVIRQQLADLQRDNGILKRAVAIQNTRLQVRLPSALIWTLQHTVPMLTVPNMPSPVNNAFNVL